MNYNHNPQTGSVLQGGRFPWPLFLFLTVVLYLGYHDLSHAKWGIDNYDLSQDDFVASIKGSVVPHIAVLSLGIVAIATLVRHRTDIRLRINGTFGWLVLGFVAWAFISVIWTEDLPMTTQRLAGFGILCIAAVAVVCRFTLREIILWAFFSTAAFLFIGIFAEVVFGTFRPFAPGYRFAGSLHPNGEGTECGLLLLAATAAADLEERWRAPFWACAFLAFVFLILSGSRTALVATALALFVYLAAVRNRRSKIAMTCGISLVFCFLLLFFGDGLLLGLENSIKLGRDNPLSVESFNARTMIWKDVAPYIRQRLFLGYGYGGFWIPTHIIEISEKEKWGVPDGHSAYLDYLLSLGAVGMGSYTLLLFAGIRRAFRIHWASRDPTFAFCGALLLFCALNGFLESTSAEGGILKFLWMVVLAWFAFVSPQQNRTVKFDSGSSFLV